MRRRDIDRALRARDRVLLLVRLLIAPRPSGASLFFIGDRMLTSKPWPRSPRYMPKGETEKRVPAQTCVKWSDG